MRLVFTPAAQRDLIEIREWIARDNPARARTFVEEIIEACKRIAEFPSAYTPVSGGRWPLRRKVFKHYRIFYRARDGEIRIISVMHGARDQSTVR